MTQKQMYQNRWTIHDMGHNTFENRLKPPWHNSGGTCGELPWTDQSKPDRGSGLGLGSPAARLVGHVRPHARPEPGRDTAEAAAGLHRSRGFAAAASRRHGQRQRQCCYVIKTAPQTEAASRSPTSDRGATSAGPLEAHFRRAGSTLKGATTQI